MASAVLGSYLLPSLGFGPDVDIAAGHLLRVLRQVETHQVTEESMGFSFTSKVLQPAFVLPLIIILFTSCAVGPNFHLPPVASPDAFRNAPSTVSTNSLADLPWWGVFKDQTLQNLIRTPLTNNYDLRIAISRVEQSRYIHLQTRSAFFPQVGYAGEAERGKNVVLGLPTPNQATLDSYLGGFHVICENNLLGRIRRPNDAAQDT